MRRDCNLAKEEVKVKVRKIFEKYGVVVMLLILVLFFSFRSKSFMTVTNVINISKQVAIMSILSVGMTFVLLTGGIELSLKP